MYTGILLFAVTGGSLLLGKGPLVVPGVFCAAVCAALVMAKKYRWAAALGFLAAAFSYTVQALSAVCPPCFLSAGFFMFSSIAVALLTDRKSLACLIFPVIASGFLYYTVHSASYRVVTVGDGAIEKVFSEPQGAAVPAGNGERPAPSSPATWNVSNKKALYFSPLCSHCPDALLAMIAIDPEGKTWRPVVVPEALLAEGRKELRELGFEGDECFVAGRSPSGGVPCLVDGETVITGAKRIKTYLGGN
ncbi:MAG: hypothetical protein K6U74_04535 [Firmicutes bacterium]|nr:hypothetical protein [Bacillota bacterium]